MNCSEAAFAVTPAATPWHVYIIGLYTAHNKTESCMHDVCRKGWHPGGGGLTHLTLEWPSINANNVLQAADTG